MEDLLQQGIAAYKAGKRDEARQIFITAVKQSPDSARAWGWMSNVCNNDQERTYCLKQVLRINPTNEKARQSLEQLLALPMPSSPPLSSISANPRNPSRLPGSPSIKKRDSSILYMLGGLALFVFIVVGGIGLMILYKQGVLSASRNSPTVQLESSELEYSRRASEVTAAYVNANEKIMNLQGQIEGNGYLVVDPTWQGNYFAALTELEVACRQIGGLPLPSSEMAESDYWLRLLAGECDLYVANERAGLKYADTDALDRAYANFVSMSEYFHNAANALPD